MESEFGEHPIEDSLSENVQVFVRIRPPFEYEVKEARRALDLDGQAAHADYS
jgi:hypothetical protein